MRRTRGWFIGISGTLVVVAAGYSGWKWAGSAFNDDAEKTAEKKSVENSTKTLAHLEDDGSDSADSTGKHTAASKVGEKKSTHVTEIDADDQESEDAGNTHEIAKGENGAHDGFAAEHAGHGTYAPVSIMAASQMSGSLEKDGLCQSAEYWVREGNGISAPSVAEWSETISVYQEVKAQLVDWVHAHSKALGKEKVATLESLIRETRVERPPNVDEPDLAYRGMILLTHDQHDVPVLRMGPGFLKMAREHSARARFELARAMVQAWSPCDPKIAGIFEKFSSCMGWTPNSQCTGTVSSELAWAVSSWVAAQAVPPGCQIAGLKEHQFVSCSDRLPAAERATEKTAALESIYGGAR